MMVQDQGIHQKTINMSTYIMRKIAPIECSDSPYSYQVSEVSTLTESYIGKVYLGIVSVSTINDVRYAADDVA